MTFEIGIIFFLLILAIVLFASEKVSFDVTAMILLSILLLSGILSPSEGFSGFSNSATVTIAAMFILSEGLRQTGALNSVADYFSSLGQQNFWVAIMVMMAVIGVISAFINNTAAVAIFIPVILGVAGDLNVSASKLLMPLSFASMFGGVCTLIGTSTNILVSSVAQKYDVAPFGMFEFAPLGIVLTIVGFIYLFTVGIRWIPKRREGGELTQDFEMQEYLTDVVVEPGADLVGATLKEASLTRDLDLDVIRVFKESGEDLQKESDNVLDAGDVIRIRGSASEIDKLVRREGVSLKPTKEWFDVDLEQGRDALVEAKAYSKALLAHSPLQNKKIKELKMVERFGAAVLAIRQQGELQQEDLGEVEISGGDSLLLSMERDRMQEVEKDSSFVLASEVSTKRYREDKIGWALLILAGVVGAAALDLAPIVVTAAVGVVLMVLMGIVTTEEAYEAINWKVIVLLGGVLPFGIAMEKTGAAAMLSNSILTYLGGWGPTAVVSGFFLLSMTLTNVISNQATAALLAPIAIQTAAEMGVNARPLLMAVTFAASLSFMTPVGYQTNTLIYGPGQYKFTDFTKIGTPLNLLFWIICTILIPIIWPL